MLKRNLLKALALLISAIILCAVLPLGALFSAGADGDNVIINGDFEQGADGWTLGGATALSTDAYGGTQAMRLSQPSAWGETLTRTVTVEANTDYVLSFWHKRAAGSGVWHIFVYDGTISQVLTYTDGANWYSSTAVAWAQHTITFNSGANTSVFLKFCPETAGAGDVLVDDIELYAKGENPVVPPVVITGLQNGDFEQGADGWTLGGNTAVSNAAHGGAQAMQLSNTVAWGETLGQTVGVEADTDYVLSFWTKRVSGNGAWDAYIYNKDTMTVLTPTVGNTWFSPEDAWTQVTLEFNSATATSLFLKFCPDAVKVGDILLDDVLLYKKGTLPVDPPVVITGLQNGDFEQGADGWTLGGNTAVSNAAHGGAQAMQLSNTVAWGETLGQTVGVEADTDYVLSFWTKRVSGNGAWDAYIYNKDTMTVLTPTVGNTWFSPEDAWAQVTLEFNSATATSLFLKFCPDAVKVGDILLDDVLLYKKGTLPVDPPVVITGLQNGDFEAGSNGWSVSGDTAIDYSDPHGGANAMLLSHSVAWAEALTQSVTVTADTDYTLSFWYKGVSGYGVWDVYVLDPNNNYAALTVDGQMWFDHTGDGWNQSTITFNSGDCTEIFVKFTPESSDAGTFLLDDVTLTKAGEEPILPPDPPKPAEKPLPLTSFGVERNRPASEDKNLIANASFENAEIAQWNVDTFLSDALTVVEDSTAPEGSHTLFFNTSGTTQKQESRYVFWVEIEPNTDYVFSTWLKGAYLSADNAARATVGVIDPDTETYLVMRNEHSSTAERQLLPPAWDNEWHIRSVSFNSGEKTRIGVALCGYGSQLWLDGIALFRVDNGIKYVGNNTTSSMPINYAIEYTTCKEEDSLTQNIHMDDGTAFWDTAKGWRNGCLSLQESKYEYGASLKYTASEDPVGIHYIQWIDVKPNTDYIFSASVKILEDGYGQLVLIDGKKRNAQKVLQVDFISEYYGEDWFRPALSFNTGVFETIGIGIVDAGGAALIDNIRLFEVVDGAAVEDAYVEPPAPPAKPEKPVEPGELEDPEETVTDPEEIVTDPEEIVTDPEEIVTDPEPEEEEQNTVNKQVPVTASVPWLWIGIGGGVGVAGLTLLCILLLKRRKKAQKAATESDASDAISS